MAPWRRAQQHIGYAAMGQRDSTDVASELRQLGPPVALHVRADAGREVLDQQRDQAIAPAAGIVIDLSSVPAQPEHPAVQLERLTEWSWCLRTPIVQAYAIREP